MMPQRRPPQQGFNGATGRPTCQACGADVSCVTWNDKRESVCAPCGHLAYLIVRPYIGAA